MVRIDGGSRAAAKRGWSHRLAGGLMVVVGALNLFLGLLSLATDQILLSPGVAGGLITAGLVTAAVGVFVWRGSRLATFVALTVFGLLLVVQLGDVATGPGPSGPDLADHPVTRVGVLVLLVASLALAAWSRKGRGRPAS